MATFFLTKKTFKSLKKTVDPEPQIIPAFDGWYVDIFNIGRRKAIIFTHAVSFLSFFCYLTDAGGSKNIFDWFLGEIDSFLLQNSPINHKHIVRMLSTRSSFHKTWSRKVIGHMTDFKNLIQKSDLSPNSVEDFKSSSEFLHNVVVRVDGKNFARPKELFLKTLT